MARKKENKRADGYYEYKCIVDHTFDGKPIYKSFYSKKSKADARSKAEEYKIALEKEKNQRVDMLFDTCCDDFMQHIKPYVKITTYRTKYETSIVKHIKPYFSGKLVKSIIKQDVEEYMREKEKELAYSTVINHLSCLKQIFAEAVDNGYIENNPCQNIKPSRKKKKSEKRTYTPEQTELVLDYCRRDPFGMHVHIILSYGVSCSEYMGITIKDVDFENKSIAINKGLVKGNKYTPGNVIISETKNKYRNRIIAVSDETIEMIKANAPKMYLNNPDSEGVLPVNTFRCRYESFMKRMQKYYEAKGIYLPLLNMHELRHTRATIWVNSGKNLFAIAQQMGWANLEMLRKVYGHGDIQQLRKELDI